MDTEKAWDLFKSQNSIQKASISEKLDTISAQLNEIKTDSSRTASIVPKIMGDDNALNSAEGDAGESPPESPEDLLSVLGGEGEDNMGTEGEDNYETEEPETSDGSKSTESPEQEGDEKKYTISEIIELLNQESDDEITEDELMNLLESSQENPDGPVGKAGDVEDDSDLGLDAGDSEMSMDDSEPITASDNDSEDDDFDDAPIDEEEDEEYDFDDNSEDGFEDDGDIDEENDVELTDDGGEDSETVDDIDSVAQHLVELLTDAAHEAVSAGDMDKLRSIVDVQTALNALTGTIGSEDSLVKSCSEEESEEVPVTKCTPETPSMPSFTELIKYRSNGTPYYLNHNLTEPIKKSMFTSGVNTETVARAGSTNESFKEMVAIRKSTPRPDIGSLSTVNSVRPELDTIATTKSVQSSSKNIAGIDRLKDSLRRDWAEFESQSTIKTI